MSTTEPIIYIIDDDDAVRESLTWLISSIDFKVDAYASANDFLEHCGQAQVGCIITDIRMPGMSGLDLQKELNKRGVIFRSLLLPATVMCKRQSEP